MRRRIAMFAQRAGLVPLKASVTEQVIRDVPCAKQALFNPQLGKYHALLATSVTQPAAMMLVITMHPRIAILAHQHTLEL